MATNCFLLWQKWQSWQPWQNEKSRGRYKPLPNKALATIAAFATIIKEYRGYIISPNKSFTPPLFVAVVAEDGREGVK